MPIPFILGAAAFIAGAAGVGSGIRGGIKMKDANDTMKIAQERHNKNIDRFKKQNKKTTTDMDNVGRLELNILSDFKEFQDVFEKIKNRPEFKEYKKEGINLPKYDGEKLKEVSIGAGVLMGGIGGAAAGTAGGFAAAGATTTAVMALGTASTGTAIASLSGAAATNATLALLGGGAVGSSATAGGMALGSAVLGGATLGVGLLVGGMIFNFTGSKLSDKADEAYSQMLRAEEKIDKSCEYMRELSSVSKEFLGELNTVNDIYAKTFAALKKTVLTDGKTNWNDFTGDEKLTTENTVLLVALLYNMCKVKLVLKSDSEDEPGEINKKEISGSINEAKKFIADKNLAA